MAQTTAQEPGCRCVMKVPVRRSHRWLMLLVGGQVLFWSLSGLYMVWFDIHYIHGDHFIESPAPLESNATTRVEFNDIINMYPGASSILLSSERGRLIYQVVDNDQIKRVDSITGNELKPVNPVLAGAIAASQLRKGYPVESVELLSSENHAVGGRGRPLWEVKFEGMFAPVVYVSRYTGNIEYVRHLPWHIFDVFWRIHIMDYQDGEDVANTLLITISSLSLLGVFFGIYLLPGSIKNPKRKCL